MSARRIVVVVSGASGAVYPRRILGVLAAARTGALAGVPADPALDVHWVATANAQTVWQQELGEPMPESIAGTRRWASHDFGAPFASGSNPADAVIVAPCSMSMLARVANGGGSDLGARACEVALKERKPLILLARETPLSLVHLRNMVSATEAGAIVMPAVPSFYAAGASTGGSAGASAGWAGAGSLEAAIDTVVARALDRAGLPLPLVRRWGELP